MKRRAAFFSIKNGAPAFCGISRENLRCVELTETSESSLGSHVWEPRLSGADAVVVFMVRSRARNRAAIPAVELRWRDGERKLRADQEEGDAPHGPVPKRATPSKNIKKKKKKKELPFNFSKMGEHALCGAHWQKRRPPHEIEQWRQSTVCRKVSSVHEERASSSCTEHGM